MCVFSFLHRSKRCVRELGDSSRRVSCGTKDQLQTSGTAAYEGNLSSCHDTYRRVIQVAYAVGNRCLQKQLSSRTATEKQTVAEQGGHLSVCTCSCFEFTKGFINRCGLAQIQSCVIGGIPHIW